MCDSTASLHSTPPHVPDIAEYLLNCITFVCLWNKTKDNLFQNYKAFCYPAPVKRMSPIFFLAVKHNFDNLHHLSRSLILSVASVRLWQLWALSSSSSSASPHSEYIGECFNPVLFRCRCRLPCSVMGRKLATKTLLARLEAIKPNPAFHSSYKLYFTRRSLAARSTAVSWITRNTSNVISLEF